MKLTCGEGFLTTL